MTLSASRLTLAALAAVAVAAGATTGCGSSGGKAANAASKEAKPAGGNSSSSSAASVPPASVKLVIKSDEEHGRKGPEGTWHDAYLPSGFTVQPSQQVTVTVYNYDGGSHSFTSPSLGVNQVIAGGSKDRPHKVTFTFKAPSTAGQYEWWCAMPCDTWAMTHKGYMRGVVTVA